MKKFMIGIVVMVLVAMIGVTLAEYVNWNPDLYTGYVYTRGDEWNSSIGSGHEWIYSGLTHQITYSEIVRLYEKGYRFSWVPEALFRAIGITIADGVVLVIYTEDARLIHDLGSFYLSF